MRTNYGPRCIESSHPSKKYVTQHKEESECGPRSRFDAYNPLTTSQDKFWKECTNTEFKEVMIRKSYQVRESSGKNKFKYYHFQKSDNCHTNYCI